MVRAYRGVPAGIAASAHIDPSAKVIGDVAIGDRGGAQVIFRMDAANCILYRQTYLKENS